MQQQANTWIDVLAGAAARGPDKVGFRYLSDTGAETSDLTYGAFDRRARAVAAGLAADGLMPGDRAVLWYPSGLDYLAAFFGCLYAGVVAVPAYPPTPRRLERVLGILADCRPRAILSTAAVRAKVMAATAGMPDGLVGQLPQWIATDEIDRALAGAWHRPTVSGDTVAFLQYTSGSTASPRGVVLTHDNLLANSDLTHRLFGTSDATAAVSWLPMYHDMGLIGAILQTIFTGGTCVLMSPAAFAKEPVRWLRAISDSGADASGGPNFAYDLCVDRITEEQCAGLDLSRWRLAFNGAEPIRPQTHARFAEAFGPYGFRAEAFTPCYGLAEATLMVTSKPLGTPVAVQTSADRTVVGAGVVPDGIEVLVVDPVTCRRRPDGAVGEIWVSGPSVGRGYWQRPEQTREPFQAVLADGPATRFLRTGDLGYRDGAELFVTGRHKDLVIVRGRNHYPQDIEQTVEGCDPVLRRNGGAAFAVAGADGVEGLVVVHEIERGHDGTDPAVLARQVMAAVAGAHDVRPDAVVLIRAGSLARTSSGKVQRHR